jgi:hypothetical protein
MGEFPNSLNYTIIQESWLLNKDKSPLGFKSKLLLKTLT